MCVLHARAEVKLPTKQLKLRAAAGTEGNPRVERFRMCAPFLKCFHR